ncbi:hypothetical protein MMC25_005146 [Agyrium rufum]|nr:hypothetical protein [Agyrium rufum]
MSNYPSWDSNTNRPIVDGKIENPRTGAVEPKGSILMDGPPAIDTIWRTLDQPDHPSLARESNFMSLDQCLVMIAGLIRSGYLSFTGITATPYYVFVLCQKYGTKEDFHRTKYESAMSCYELEHPWPLQPAERSTTPQAESPQLPQRFQAHVGLTDDAIANRGTIEATWYNLNSDWSVQPLHQELFCTAETLFLEIVDHVKSGKYGIISISADKRTFTIVCSLQSSLTDVEEGLRRLSKKDVP